MSGYLLHFIVYTMAMLGLIFLAVFTYKFVYGNKLGIKSSTLSVTDSMKLTPKKTLYVVKAGNEKFLIASDFDSTTLISKLNDKVENISENEIIREDKSKNLSNYDGLKCMDDFIEKFENVKTDKKPVMRELVRKLRIAG